MFKRIWELLKATFQDWSKDKAPRLAAALSYYTIFSLAPLLVLVIAITGFIIGNNATIRDTLMTQVQTLVGAKGADIVNTLIQNTSQPRRGIIATIIGIVTLLLGATGVFGQLQDSLNTIWNVQPKEGRGIWNVIKDRLLSFTMVLGISFLLLVSLVVSAGLAVLNSYFTNLLGGAGIIAQIVNYAVNIGIITLIFALIFKVLPDVKIAWRDVWIGALVTAVLFLIGQSLISLYLSSTASASAYGAAGSLIVILLWVYYSAQILFLGAEFTQVYARQTGKAIEPSENARPVSEAERARQGMHPVKSPATVRNVQQAIMPVTGQPDIHPATEGRERVRYEPANPNTVIPVVAAGALAGIFTVGRIIKKIASSRSAERDLWEW